MSHIASNDLKHECSPTNNSACLDTHGSHDAEAHGQPAASAMSVLAAGAGLAVGLNTNVTGEITNQMVKEPGVTIDYGEVDFTATASSPAGGHLTATTTASVNVQGADFLIEFIDNSHGHNSYSAWSHSDIRFVAIDIANWQPPHGQTIVEVINSGAVAPWQPENFQSGNLAALVATAQTYGADTSTSTLAITSVVDHHLSAAFGYAFAVG